MKYYRLAKEQVVKYVALPSEFWLPLAEYVCFNPGYEPTIDALNNIFNAIADREDEPDWDLSELSAEYDTCVELTQEEYRKLTGGIENACYYHRNEVEPYFEGEMPDDWEDVAMQALLPSSYWADNFGYNGDYHKLVDDQIDNRNMFETLVEMMQGVDPELETEAYDRWIYAHAVEAIG